MSGLVPAVLATALPASTFVPCFRVCPHSLTGVSIALKVACEELDISLAKNTTLSSLREKLVNHWWVDYYLVYCTISTNCSQGVTRDVMNYYQPQFTSGCDLWRRQKVFIPPRKFTTATSLGLADPSRPVVCWGAVNTDSHHRNRVELFVALLCWAAECYARPKNFKNCMQGQHTRQFSSIQGCIPTRKLRIDFIWDSRCKVHRLLAQMRTVKALHLSRIQKVFKYFFPL